MTKIYDIDRAIAEQQAVVAKETDKALALIRLQGHKSSYDSIDRLIRTNTVPERLALYHIDPNIYVNQPTCLIEFDTLPVDSQQEVLKFVRDLLAKKLKEGGVEF